MKRIYADFNNSAADGRVRLDAAGILAEIREVGARSGERVLLSDGEIQVEGVLELAGDRGNTARPDWDTLVHLDEEPLPTAAVD